MTVQVIDTVEKAFKQYQKVQAQRIELQNKATGIEKVSVEGIRIQAKLDLCEEAQAHFLDQAYQFARGELTK